MELFRIPPDTEFPMVVPRVMKSKIFQRMVDTAHFDLVDSIQKDLAAALVRQITMTGGRPLVESMFTRVTFLRVTGEVGVEVWCPAVYFKASERELAASRRATEETEIAAAGPPQEEVPQ